MDLMALVARGRIEDANAGTYAFAADAEYLLAGEEGYEVLYLLQGDSEELAPHEAALVEITGEVVGAEPSGKYEILAVQSVRRIDGAAG
ncbi:hypothetical protein GBA65_11760 [Rubrobacter marinus]|uniref:Uncharacterized protein n=1 Tax=Rubrobacter marinus TaxID=2653852 RepID=A0A6G8PY44_9ACTN|nr:hypothetical protein [Rubrobacter marinus]QIN79085.1 hypothetical protein GBA65_11760 [Rubrobacter marinus]